MKSYGGITCITLKIGVPERLATCLPPPVPYYYPIDQSIWERSGPDFQILIMMIDDQYGFANFYVVHQQNERKGACR
jgi:hypothetical protein